MPANEGLIIQFREEGTETLLWEACLHSLPREGDTLGYSTTGGEAQQYKVEQVVYRFWKPISQGPPIPSVPSTTMCQCRPTIYVSALTERRRIK